MKPAPFEYVRAASLDEAVEMLAENAWDAKILAGGQSLVPLLRFRLTYIDKLIDIGRIETLRGIATADDGTIQIGAMTRQTEAELDPVLAQSAPLFTEALRLVGHPEIRNRGTVGGSIAHADPAAELPAVAVALDAHLVSRSANGTRTHDAETFFASFFTTALDADEILTEIQVPRRAPAEGSAILEVSRRPGDFALAGVAARVRLEEGRCSTARVVLFGVGATPIRARDAEARLTGTELLDADLADAAGLAANGLDPPDDVRASSAYRRHASQVLCGRALARARDRALANSERGTDAA